MNGWGMNRIEMHDIKDINYKRKIKNKWRFVRLYKLGDVFNEGYVGGREFLTNLRVSDSLLLLLINKLLIYKFSKPDHSFPSSPLKPSSICSSSFLFRKW